MNRIESEKNQRHDSRSQQGEKDVFDQFVTQPRLRAFSAPPPTPTFLLMDGVAFEEQATWIIPVIQAPTQKPIKLETASLGVGGYSSQLRSVLKSSGIYALASLATPIVALVLAPFLTRTLSHADYGSLALINTAIALLAGITQLGLWTACLRSYTYDYDTMRDRLDVLSTVVVLLVLVSVPIMLLIVIGAPWEASLLLKNSLQGNYISAAVLVVLLQNLAVPGLAWMRAENRAIAFAVLSISNLLLDFVITVVLVGFLHMGVVGSLLGTACGYAVVVICTLPLILLRAGVRIRVDIARGLLSFGLPSVSSYIALWMLQLVDRFLLAQLRSLSETAIYTVAYSLGGILSVLVLSPFSMAWSVAQFTVAKRDDASTIFRLVFRWYSIVLFFAAYALSLAAIFVLNTFFPLAYHVATPIIPIITLATLFYGIYNFLTLGMSIRRKNWFSVIFTTIAALVNIGLNLLFIPLYGSMGAAVATLLAYTLLACCMYVFNQRIYPVSFEITLFGVALGLGILFYLGSSFLAQEQKVSEVGWTIQFFSLFLYGICLLCLGKFWSWNFIPHTTRS